MQVDDTERVFLMGIKTWRKQTTSVLLAERERQRLAMSTWERRIRDHDSGVDMSIMRPKREYIRRVKRCKEKIGLIDEVLRERGMIG